MGVGINFCDVATYTAFKYCLVFLVDSAYIYVFIKSSQYRSVCTLVYIASCNTAIMKQCVIYRLKSIML